MSHSKTTWETYEACITTSILGWCFVGEEKHLKWVRGWSHSRRCCREKGSTLCLGRQWRYCNQDTVHDGGRQLAASRMKRWCGFSLISSDICPRDVPKRHLSGVTVAIIKHSCSSVKARGCHQECLMRPVLLVINAVMTERDSCGACSLRLAIWTETKSLCLPVHERVWDNSPSKPDEITWLKWQMSLIQIPATVCRNTLNHLVVSSENWSLL